jgi:hypothetical protein
VKNKILGLTLILFFLRVPVAYAAEANWSHCVGASCPPAEQIDPNNPYAAATRRWQREEVRAHTARMLDEARYGGFAQGCQVIPDGRVLLFKYDLLNTPTDDTWHADPEAVARAFDEGATRALAAGACDYFQEHPEEVLRLRRASAAMFMGY